jgi:hypothetical protein
MIFHSLLDPYNSGETRGWMMQIILQPVFALQETIGSIGKAENMEEKYAHRKRSLLNHH